MRPLPAAAFIEGKLPMGVAIRGGIFADPGNSYNAKLAGFRENRRLKLQLGAVSVETDPVANRSPRHGEGRSSIWRAGRKAPTLNERESARIRLNCRNALRRAS